ncbi:lipopolysaccharide biosynthesis protein [Terrabacter sp. NPDC000476]|uniref:lipopolysaccharide biosynthesis protein n=1 Tax=Terrabacter sp. NPDC000476 TaxID=3154258 RepID=UPI003330E4B4
MAERTVSPERSEPSLPPPAAGAEDTSPALRRIARGGTANLVGAAVTGVAQFALTVVVTRLLSQAEAGVFFSTTSLFLLAVVVGNLGSNVGLVYFLSRCRALGRTDLVGAYLSAALRPVVVVSVLLAVGLFVSAPELARITVPDQAELGSTVLRVLSLFIPLASLENVTLAGTRGLGTMRPNMLVALVGRPVLQLLLVALALVLGLHVAAVSAGWSVAYLATGVAAIAWLRRLARAARHDATGTAATAPPAGDAQDEPDAHRVGRQFWAFSSPRALTSILQIAMQRLDIVLVGALAGAGAAAVYTAATRFVVVGQTLGTALGNASDPRIAEGMARDDRTDVSRIYQTSTAWLVTLTWPMFLMLVVYRDSMLAVFGSGYTSAQSTLVVLSLAMLLSTLCGTVDSIIMMAGHTSWNLANAVVAAAVMFGLDVLLIPTWGVFGAAVGWASAIVVRNVVALAQARIALQLHPFGRATLIAVGLVLVSFLLVPLLTRAALGSGLTAIVVSAVVGGLLWLAGLRVFRGPLDLAALGALRGRGRRPSAS